jgi:tRNA-2-methylthio-N6-dimethylallyladenosine synthase
MLNTNSSQNSKKLFIKTYGCQMNVYDSERMQELFAPFGYNIQDSYEDADLVILNTCHIREKAAEKVYSELGRINQEKERLKITDDKNMVISVAGCVAQAEGDQIIKRAPYVDIVVGPQSYHQLPSLVQKINNNENINPVALEFIEEEKFDLLPKKRGKNNVAAFVSIQEGCDKFCSFCVVPYTRGAEFSRPVEKILSEAKELVETGTKEITLLGQNVNAYHGVNSKGQNTNLGQLIFALEKIDGLMRIRYMTSHPNDMHDDLYEAHALSKKLMPFLHLPVQSGSDRILKLMNRKHNTKSYLDILSKLKIARPDLAFSSDFIVGFPGETDQDFEDTMELVKQVNYSQCFSFKYSPRPGTPAAIKEDQVPEKVKAERLKKLQTLLSAQQFEFNQKFENKELDVLFDRISGDQIIGRSPYLQPIYMPMNKNKSVLNQIKKVRITHSGPHSLQSELA